MRILFITREGMGLSGARVRCYNFARELSRHGLETGVYSFGDHLGAPYGEKELGMPLGMRLSLNWEAFRTLAKEGRDTVFVLQRFNYHALAPLVVSLFKGNRIIFDCDDWNIREDPVYYLGFYPSSKMEFLTRKIARRAKACFVASRFLEDYLKEFNPKVYYLPTGVDTDLFAPRKDVMGTKVVFSWIGTAYHKDMGENIRFILDCFSEVADRYDNVALGLAGEGKYFEEVRADIARYKHNSKVEIHPWIPPDNIPEYLSRIHVGLLPLIQDSKFNKAKSPTKLFEYMSMAKPTISSDIGESRNIIRNGETGLLARNREEFVSCMRTLVEDPGLRQVMGRQAREEVEKKYSLKVLGKGLADIVKNIFAGE